MHGMITIYLDAELLQRSSILPGRNATRGTYGLHEFAPHEVYLAFNVTIKAVSSYLTFSPLPTEVLVQEGLPNCLQ